MLIHNKKHLNVNTILFGIICLLLNVTTELIFMPIYPAITQVLLVVYSYWITVD